MQRVYWHFNGGPSTFPACTSHTLVLEIPAGDAEEVDSSATTVSSLLARFVADLCLRKGLDGAEYLRTHATVKSDRGEIPALNLRAIDVFEHRGDAFVTFSAPLVDTKVVTGVGAASAMVHPEPPINTVETQANGHANATKNPETVVSESKETVETAVNCPVSRQPVARRLIRNLWRRLKW